MASLPIAWNNGFLISPQRVNICVRKIGVWGKLHSLSSPLPKNRLISVQNPLLFCCSPVKAQNRFLCKSAANEKINVDTQLVREKEKNEQRRRNFSLRLRPRLRLLSRRLKKASIKSLLDHLETFMRKNGGKVTISSCISIALALCFWFLKVTSIPSPKSVPYSHLISNVRNGSISNVSFEEGTGYIYYNTKLWDEKKSQTEVDDSDNNTEGNDGENKVDGEKVISKPTKARSSSPGWEFSTRKIDQDVGYLLSLMRETGTLYGSAPQSPLKTIRNSLITMLMLWIPLSPLVWLLYNQISAGNNPTRKRKPKNQLVCFDDVAGVDGAKVELVEIVNCLQGAIKYSNLGAKLPRGVLLVGPPGTGKTLLARAVAGEAGVPFFPVSASEFVELFVGRGAARVRELFDVARKNAPSIVFIDELDAVGGRRGRSFNDERDQTLNQLLTEMDGFESDVNVVVIAATNRPEALDPALCRPGRFSRKVFVGQPDEDGRKKILAIHLRGVPLEEDMGLICNLVASLTQGFVGADLANIVNEAALLAARRGAENVSREDIMEAIERAKFGINERRMSPSKITKELEKLFPWMPSIISRNDNRGDAPQGYQALS